MCATPIGHLADASFRLIETLKQVDLIAAEDTRVTRKLLDHYQIQTPMISLQKYNEFQKSQAILDRILLGQDVALVSDAGTPAISDPGAYLVAQLKDQVPVIPIPGPSALSTFVSVSGILADSFCFFGFIARKVQDRQAQLKDADHCPAIFFESGKRIQKTLEWICQEYPGYQMVIAKELTKRHETIWYDYQKWLTSIESDPSCLKGEWIFSVQGSVKTNDPTQEWVDSLKAKGLSVDQIIWIGQTYHGFSRNDLYRLFHV